MIVYTRVCLSWANPGFYIERFSGELSMFPILSSMTSVYFHHIDIPRPCSVHRLSCQKYSEVPI